MSIITNFLHNLPMYLLSLPVLLMAFSVHETAHGYVAWRLGDPTARNLGRLTLNPIKHLDPIGTICMVLFHIGWAKPVPINTRYFKNPKRDMALSGAAGPVSNLLLALIHLLLLCIGMLFVPNLFKDEIIRYELSLNGDTGFKASLGFIITAVLTYILYLGVVLNLSLAIFNLIPVPPFDGSRIFYAFLPTKWYFAVMKYERYIMIAILILFWVGLLDRPLGWLLNVIINGLFKLTGLMPAADGSPNGGITLNIFLYFIDNLLRPSPY